MAKIDDLTAYRLVIRNFEDLRILNPEVTLADAYESTMKLFGLMDPTQRSEYEAWLNKEIFNTRSSDLPKRKVLANVLPIASRKLSTTTTGHALSPQ